MTISTTLEAKILRYYHVEKWRVGTISRELNVHHCTIERVLAKTGIPKPQLLPAPSMVTPYLPFILETLEQFPKLTASRLYQMVRERGYPGGSSHFRHIISLHRPRRAAEAYLRLRTLPGEQAQVDWGHFGHLTIGRAKRPLMAFVMVLSYCRKVFLCFSLNQRMSSFLKGHEGAFNAFGGVPRVCLYDNLKSAVLERQGDAIRFHPTLLEFSAHYRFEPRPVAVARGNEKGRVERAIRYVRDSFFAGREFKDVEDLNAQAQHWCEGVAADRPCPEDRSQSVKATFEQEKVQLLSLPETDYPTDEQVTVRVGKTPYVRFDLNDYSVPHTATQCALTVVAAHNTLKILDGVTVIASHPRSYDKAQQIENPEHIQALVNHKKQAREHRGKDRLSHALPCGARFLKKAAQKNYHMASMTRILLEMLDDYGPLEMERAMQAALAKEVPHHNTVRTYLQRYREQHQQLPPVPLDLPQDKRIRDQVVRVHDLQDYDQLQPATEKNNNPLGAR